MVRFLEKLPAHQPAGAHKHAAPYSSQRAPRCGRALGRAGEITAFLNILTSLVVSATGPNIMAGTGFNERVH